MSPDSTAKTDVSLAERPCWDGYRQLARALDAAAWPSPRRLTRALPPGAVSGGGRPLRFVAAEHRPGVDYERHVYETGEVPTRSMDWHDRCNAMAWCRWPRLKAAMNAAHYRHLGDAVGGRRGRRRDALTLLDESGALVASHDGALLEALARREWTEAFLQRRASWPSSVRVLVCGHALLDKCRNPYRSMTAQALLLRVPDHLELAGEAPLDWLDAAIAAELDADRLCLAPGELSPLPLAGVPGWWCGPQDAVFYADRSVFRPPRIVFAPAPVHRPRSP